MGELMPDMSGIASGAGLGPTSKEIGYSPSELKALGNGFGKEAPGLESLGKRTGAMGIGFPAFGVVGIGLLSATDQARDSAVQALEAGAKVLNSWKTALASMADDIEQREKDIKASLKEVREASAVSPKSDLSGLGGAGLDGAGLGGAGLDGAGLGGTGLPDTGLPDRELAGMDGLDPTTPNLEARDIDTPSTGLPDSNLPTSDIPGLNTGLPQAPDTNIPGLDPSNAVGTSATPNLGLTDPGKTGLAGYTPANLTTSQPSVPEAGTWSGDSARSAGYSSGAAGGGQSPLAGARGAAANGMSGMPFMPMGGAGAGGEQRKENNSSLAGLSGDEGDWEDDIDVAPAVLGQES
ncbi:hypothetical protein [Streptosporangium amethystogenes]|uniref:hypothetical protein n=1 Tax=Streptosporangium amethystogenes TaxID=2002 RepID=UPI0004CBB6D2|nr:hypothetical protein [Streptosporangium amethystogenes]